MKTHIYNGIIFRHNNQRARKSANNLRNWPTSELYAAISEEVVDLYKKDCEIGGTARMTAMYIYRWAREIERRSIAEVAK